MQIATSRALPAAGTLMGLLVVAGVLVPGFLRPASLLGLGQQVAPLFFVALGQTVVLLTGGLDMSVGAVLTMGLVVSAGVMQGQEGMAIWGAAAALGVGALVGLVNGLLVAGLRISPLIATLGTMFAVQGIAWVYTGGAPGGAVANSIRFLANGRLGPLPVAVLVMAAALVVVAFALDRSRWGRLLYAVGANPATAFLSGIAVKRVVVTAYVLCGTLAGAAGLLLAGYVGMGTLEGGDPYILNSIVASILGGTTFAGGVGGVWGTAVGVGILAVLTSIFIQLQIPIGLRYVFISLILVAAAVLQARGGDG